MKEDIIKQQKKLYPNLKSPEDSKYIIGKSNADVIEYYVYNNGEWFKKNISSKLISEIVFPNDVYLLEAKEDGKHKIQWFGKLPKDQREMSLFDLKKHMNLNLIETGGTHFDLLLGYEFYDHIIDKNGIYNNCLLSRAIFLAKRKKLAESA